MKQWQKILASCVGLMLVSVLAVGGSPKKAQKPGTSLRVMTYNIHHGAGTDGKLDLDRIFQVIAREKPELLSLNEVYGEGPAYGNQVETLRALLEKKTGKKWYAVFGKNLEIPNGHYGNAILSRYPILKQENRWMTRIPESNEQRGCLKIQVKKGKLLINFYTTHLAHQGESTTERSYSVTSILNWMKESPGFHLVAGDFNAKYNEDAIISMKTSCRDAWERINKSPDKGFSFSATQPKVRIDYQFARETSTLSISTCYVPGDKMVTLASDHRPVVVEYRLR